ncbi:hypothetical protein [Herbiconiux daphne]|uniref:Uncharacterized protein n=1 Tax=Herbiconiux daphne TaxID=2970914 RepID=A0ABT2H9B1_9MICO|nr:hypothetical protein [Herbiconiux daphne]MCS5736528.1 hypothetical protein [Herbiconiux daphne]
MKLIKALVAITVLAVMGMTTANAASVTYHIADAGKIVWENDTLQAIDLEGNATPYTLDATTNDVTLDNGDVNDIMIFHKNDEPARQIIIAHDKSKSMSVIMPVLHGKELGQYIVDDRYTTFHK